MNTWSPETYLILAAMISAVPILVSVGSCYLKFSIVLTLLKSGFGTQSAPSASLVMSLSIVMSLVVMQPVISETTKQLESFSLSEVGKLPIKELLNRGGRLVGPWRAFLLKHSGDRELMVFSDLTLAPASNLPEMSPSAESKPLDKDSLGLATVVGAFVVSEIKQAFVMVFFLLVPFFIIDLIVANLLVGLGLTMMSPIIVSLPIKLLLFITADGWLLLAQSLIRAYQ